MHFDCELDGLSENWVEVCDIWTRKEIAEMVAESGAVALIGWLQRKLTACHIETTDGEAITSPDALTVEAIDERMDVRLYDFLGVVLVHAARELRRIGPLSVRLSSKK